MNVSRIYNASRIYTLAEVANLLRLNRSTIYRLIRQEKFPAFRVGSDYRIAADQLDKWIEARSSGPKF